MPQLPSLPEHSTLFELFRQFPGIGNLLAPLHEFIMRGPASISAKDRELIATFVSTVNACDYCVGSHGEVAKAFGVPAETIALLANGIDSAPVDEKLRPILRYVEKLTRTPTQMTQADADAVFAAGWDEDALFQAILVCCVFNFMNRLVEGTGLEASEQQASMGGKFLFEKGYVRVAESTTTPPG
jgi:uncharacterized peroxidase-related enzyme